ncbi:MAG: hypothetical protein KAW17_09770 [Candidatus Eisenbacteria sp.]|nr:hypothetical protein [Candidatus Eisenbacteria bacterium]
MWPYGNISALVEGKYRPEFAYDMDMAGGGATSDAVIVTCADPNEIIHVLGLNYAGNASSALTLESKSAADKVELAKYYATGNQVLGWPFYIGKTRAGDDLVYSVSVDVSTNLWIAFFRIQARREFTTPQP